MHESHLTDQNPPHAFRCTPSSFYFLNRGNVQTISDSFMGVLLYRLKVWYAYTSEMLTNDLEFSPLVLQSCVRHFNPRPQVLVGIVALIKTGMQV